MVVRSKSSRGSKRSSAKPRVDLYGTYYRNFFDQIYADIRRETFGEDIGQQSWLTSTEQDQFISWLSLDENSRLLDVCCGMGGPALRIAHLKGCFVFGLDNEPNAITTASAMAESQGLIGRAKFKVFDASESLPFESESFDSLVCIDAINHLRDRRRVLGDWSRVVRPSGKILFTDPVTITGILSSDEIATRSSIGFFLFTPKGEDGRLLRDVGLKVLKMEDVTENVEDCARKRHEAREKRARALRKIEGRETFEGQQEFLRTTGLLAKERRLSRFVYLAEKA